MPTINDEVKTQLAVIEMKQQRLVALRSQRNDMMGTIQAIASEIDAVRDELRTLRANYATTLRAAADAAEQEIGA